MHDQTYLQQQALKFIDGLDRSFPAFSKIDWSSDSDSLLHDCATACRDALVALPIGPKPEHVTERVARPDETPEQLIKRCLAGTWRSVGEDFDFPNGLDYHCSPDPQLNTRGLPYGEWTWQINRHSEWVVAAKMFHHTGEDWYAEAVAGWLRSWLCQCPMPDEDLNARQGPWRTIEIGIRLGSAWPAIISALYRHPAIDDVLFLAWLQAYAEQAAFVYQYRKRNNWLLMEMNGLMHAGVQVPFHKQSTRWRQQATEVLLEEIGTQFHPDGHQVELSASYHGVCFHNYMRAVKALHEGGYSVDPRLEQCLKDQLKPLRALARHNGRGKCFDFQDSQQAYLGHYLKQCPESWYEDGDQWFIDGSGKPPQTLHHYLANAGYAIMRSGYGDDELSVAFDGGPYGDGHQHEDKLSVQIYAHSKDLIGEAGKVDYNDSPERRYSLTTLAHSTALVDGLGQNRGKTYRDNPTPLEATADMPHDFSIAEPWAESTYDEGYGPDQLALVKHKRRVILKSKNEVEIIDEFMSSDGKAHSIEILFHCLTDDAKLDTQSLTTLGDHVNASLHWDSDTSIEASLVCGGDTPDLRGWAEPDGNQDGKLVVVPRPCLTLKLTCEDTARVRTVIRILD